jgi:hypothetical protein
MTVAKPYQGFYLRARKAGAYGTEEAELKRFVPDAEERAIPQ